MENSKYLISDGSIKIDNFSLQVGMSPDAFFIPADINDIIKSVIIKTNDQGFVTEEQYSMENGDKISRSYRYNDARIEEVITNKISNGKEVYHSRSLFKYD
ncbi:hypothetical protein [Aggregatibacter actinomycetemcomitans]|uniref:hypothetical protein n=1 Tax=Aggregatibacter actinomycetemcomitans TaxID=714 RepID=UPI001F11EB0B|nr:hypothetical protein [Aggregatibacter actinomycetemcomitans]